VTVNNSTNINKTNNILTPQIIDILTPQIIEHTKEHVILSFNCRLYYCWTL